MKEGRRWIVVLTGAIVAVFMLRGFLFTSYIIPSSGMENTLYQGDRILVNKWSYGLRIPCMSLLSYHRWLSRRAHTGEIVVFNNPVSENRVIDQRNIYIGRCVAAPGDTLWADSLLSTPLNQERVGPDRKRLYNYPAEHRESMDSLLRELSITNNELMGHNDSCYMRSFSHYEYYLLEQALGEQNWVKPATSEAAEEKIAWIVPQKGKAIAVKPWNMILLRNTLLLHEGREVYIKNDSLYVDGKHATSCTFSKDYYWVASNNSLSLSDSRLFGLVPHDHLIGRASLIWFSKEGYSGLFNGYRWNRFFTSVK